MVFALVWAETECITIKKYVEIKGEKVYLSDLIETEDSKILEQAGKVEIIRSPGAGKEKIVEGRYIKIKMTMQFANQLADFEPFSMKNLV